MNTGCHNHSRRTTWRVLVTGRTWWQIILFLLLSIGLVPGGIIQPAQAQPPRRALPQGEWMGSFTYEGLVFTLGYISAFGYSGLANFTVARNSASGDWESRVWTTNFVTDDECTMEMNSEGSMKGVVEGSAEILVLRDTDFNGTFTSRGGPGCDPQTTPNLTVPIPKLDESQRISVPREIHWLWVTCEQAYGRMGGSLPSSAELGFSLEDPRNRANLNAFMRDTLEAAGISMSAEDHFYAIRLSARRHSVEAAAFMDAVNQLYEDVSALLDRLLESEREGTGIPGDLFLELNGLLQRAEALAHDIRRTQDCSFVERDAYLSLLADSVGRLLAYALAHPERFYASDLYRLILAGVRTGLFEPRSVYLFGTERLVEQVHNELLRRIEISDNCADLILLGLSGEALGDLAVAHEADARFVTVCGE